MNKKGYKTYRDNKYSGRRMKVTKKCKKKKGKLLALALGTVFIVAANLIPFNIAKADEKPVDNNIYVKTIDNGDSISFKNVDYPVLENKDEIVIENTEKAPDPFNVGSSPDKKIVIDYLASPEGQLIYKYASDYGIDPNIMASIAFCESSFNHDACIPGGDWYKGAGVGLMQLESPSGEAVTAYNYNTNEWDTEYVTMDAACDLETNIKIGCMIFQNKLKENYGNIFLATQSYNYGQGMMDIIMDNLYGDRKISVMQNYSDISWLDEIENVHNYPNTYLPGWGESTYGAGISYLKSVFGCCPSKEATYKMGGSVYTVGLDTCKLVDKVEYGTIIKR